LREIEVGRQYEPAQVMYCCSVGGKDFNSSTHILIVMKHVPGVDGDELLPFMHITDIQHIVQATLSALDFFHSQNPAIIHRDLKRTVMISNQFLKLFCFLSGQLKNPKRVFQSIAQ
jgi:serine/threonine protein kinase